MQLPLSYRGYWIAKQEFWYSEATFYEIASQGVLCHVRCGFKSVAEAKKFIDRLHEQPGFRGVNTLNQEAQRVWRG